VTEDLSDPAAAAAGGHLAYDAVIFNLDTAAMQAAAWRALFDEVLAGLAGALVRPFDVDADYRRYLDGQTWVDGVRVLLAAREIELPRPDDPPGRGSVAAGADPARVSGWSSNAVRPNRDASAGSCPGSPASPPAAGGGSRTASTAITARSVYDNRGRPTWRCRTTSEALSSSGRRVRR
jgi:hypothetical protein